jgi:hypothetical protein
MDLTRVDDALWALASLVAQVVFVVVGMVRVTADGVPENSFRKILALQLATFPLVGLLVAWRWRGEGWRALVRTHVLRVQGVTLLFVVLDLLR